MIGHLFIEGILKTFHLTSTKKPQLNKLWFFLLPYFVFSNNYYCLL